MLTERLQQDVRAAMKARDPERTQSLRLLLDALQKAAKEKRGDLTDEEALAVVQREAKRRREAIESFGSRPDLVAKEAAQLAVLQEYLPEQLGDDELGRLVDEAIAETGASSQKDMGAVMKALMPKVRGRADGSAVSAAVKARLGG